MTQPIYMIASGDLRLSANQAVERELDRFPVGRIAHLQPPRDGVERRGQTSGADDSPAAGDAIDRDLLRPHWRAAQEDREGRPDRVRQRLRYDYLSCTAGRHDESRRRDGRTDRMQREHVSA